MNELNGSSMEVEEDSTESESEMEGSVVCHCRTCRGECVRTLRTCQRHMNELNGPSMEVEEDSTESESEVLLSPFSANADDNSDEGIAPSQDELKENWASQPEDAAESNSSDPICGTSNITQLDVAVALLHWFSKYPGISKAAVGELLQLLQNLMSLAMNEPVRFPTTFKQARSLMKDHLTESVRHEICHNECVLYGGENSKSKECPKCGEERRVNAKTYSAIPIIPRLQNLLWLLRLRKWPLLSSSKHSL
ncbi:hypothetical protein OS493_000343 [Desmophyllum pertusum]|uniref:Uncharacterized protein n=1 Tax=Desmophyllum pertusum TaxID=174260 RepID=A0A9X0DD99_9CNID|nr:hypothetical protein OS493_000343 [Desmophyllum pertusum]